MSRASNIKHCDRCGDSIVGVTRAVPTLYGLFCKHCASALKII